MVILVLNRKLCIRSQQFLELSIYDGEGLRVGTVQNGKASTFFYFNGELLGEEQTNRMILGYGVAASEVSGKAGDQAYHLDEQLSTGYITNAEQSLENRYTYNAFGEVREKEENIHNRILYTGQQYDQVTGQYYLRARFYNPVVGRFLQEDEYRGDGLNLYAYCGNNPMVYYDPSGFSSSTLLPDELKFGTYKDMAKQYKAGTTGLTPHHMTSDKYMATNYGVHKNDGLAMLVETTYYNSGGRHGQTSTYGSNQDEYVKLSPRDALASDVKDMKRILQEKGLYDDYAREQLRDYIKTQEQTEYSSDSKLMKGEDFNGKEIKNKKIFSKDYEDNQKKQNEQNDGCKGG